MEVEMDKLTVLVVDDDKEIVDAIGIYLSSENLNIIKAYDGMQALEILNIQKVHLILLDIMMPKLDGIKATLKIRESKNIPIILSPLNRKTQIKSLVSIWERMTIYPSPLILWNWLPE